MRERPRDVDCFLIGDALCAHEVGKFFAREISLGVEDGDVEIFVERNAALFPFADHFLVAPLEIFGVETEPLDSLVALFPIPTVGAKNSTDIEEDVLDVAHEMRTARAGAPSHPSMRSGRQMKLYSPGEGAERSRPSTITTERSRRVRWVR